MILPENRNRPALLFTFGTAITLFWAAQHVYVAFLPVYAQSLGASLSLVGLVVAGYGLIQFLLRIPLGMASDRLTRRKPFALAGFALVVASCLGLAWSPRAEWLVFFRVLAGVAASTWSATAVLFASYYPRTEAVRAVSLVAFFQQTGLVAAAVLGAVAASAWGWVAPFYVGAGLAALGLALFSRAPEEVAPAEEPVRLAQLLKTITAPRLFLVSLLGALVMYVNYTVNGFVPVYAQQLGASAAQLGWLVAAGQVAATLTALLASFLVQRWKERTLVCLALFLVTLATVAAARSTGLLALTLARLLYGLSYGPVYPILTGLSIKAVPTQERASAMSVFQAVYALGMWAGPMISGVLAERMGLNGMFILTSAVALGGTLLAWVGIVP